MTNKRYEMLLNEDYVDEVYKFVLEDYIKLFSEIIGENIESIEEKNVENIFIYMFWKVCKYSKNFNEDLLELRNDFFDIGLDKDKEKNIIKDMEKLYYNIKSKNIEEINVGDYLKELIKKNEYEFAIEVVKNIYYYPKLQQILEKKKISFDRYAPFSDIADTLMNNCNEYTDLLLTVEGHYSYEVTLKERLDDLLELTELL